MIVHQLVERAMRSAQGAQAMVRQSESDTISFENSRLKAAQSSQRTEVEVQVIVDGRLGRSITTAIGDLDGVVERALEAAEFGSLAAYELPESAPAPAVKLHDPALLSLSREEMVSIGQELVDLVKAYNAEILVGAGIGRTISRVELANSAGAECIEESTAFDVGLQGELVRGTDILWVIDSLGWKSRALDHAALAHKAINWFQLAERTAGVESGEMPVILTPEGMAILLLTLGLALDGKNVLLGESPLAGKIGQTAASPSFSLTDDPLVDYASRSSLFDGEGVPRRATPLLEQGVLQGFLYDLDTAARAQAQPTGHGPKREPTNRIVGEGDTPYPEMVRGIRRGLLVRDVLGLGQGNPISGEFSVNVALGYGIENGEVVGRVKDVMLAGNVYDALKDIVAISDRAEWVGGWFAGRIPYVQIGKLSVVAR